jgi:hypothetical protein
MRIPLLLCVGLTGCAPAPALKLDPAGTVARYAAAIAHNDPHAAYALLSSTLREQRSEAEFTLQWKAAARELATQEQRLRAQGGSLPRHANVRLADGRAVPMSHDADGWKVSAVRPLEAEAATPEEALRRFVEALEARDFDAVLRLLADPLRATVEQALNDRLEHLRRAARGGLIETSGDRARIRYDSRYHLDLVKENGQWRIADFN